MGSQEPPLPELEVTLPLLEQPVVEEVKKKEEKPLAAKTRDAIQQSMRSLRQVESFLQDYNTEPRQEPPKTDLQQEFNNFNK